MPPPVPDLYTPLSIEVEQLLRAPWMVRDVLGPPPVAYPRCPNVLIGYPGLLAWMQVYDPRRSRGLSRNLDSYRDLKRAHERATVRQLDQIWLRATGRAVLGGIGSVRSRTVVIHPFVELAVYGINATASPKDPAAATAVGMPRPGGRSGTGQGSDAVVEFTAGMWGPDGVFRRTGPGMNPDEVLLHELVHAGRQMRGVAYDLPVNGRYGDEEEFVGVLVANVYLSEKGQRVLRRDHGAGVLKDPDTFLDNPRLSPSPRILLERLRLRQPDLWAALARIGPGLAAFNPIRQYEAERAAPRK